MKLFESFILGKLYIDPDIFLGILDLSLLFVGSKCYVNLNELTLFLGRIVHFHKN